MKTAKDIFISAAKDNTAVNIGVHWELAIINSFVFVPHILQAWSNARILGETLADVTPSLWTALRSSLVVNAGPKDRFVTHDNPSAIANAKHSEFLEEHGINVALISGIAATRCVKITRDDCINRGIEPIMVTNATDLCEDPEKIWGPGCFSTTIEEVTKWVEELRTELTPQ